MQCPVCGRGIGGDRSGHCFEPILSRKIVQLGGDEVELSSTQVSPIELHLGERTGLQSGNL